MVRRTQSLVTLANHKYVLFQRAHRGDYQPGLAMLLDPSVWRGLVFSDYVLWAQEVWHILALRSTRRFVTLLIITFFNLTIILEGKIECIMSSFYPDGHLGTTIRGTTS